MIKLYEPGPVGTITMVEVCMPEVESKTLDSDEMTQVALDAYLNRPCSIDTPEAHKLYDEQKKWAASLPPGSIISLPHEVQ